MSPRFIALTMLSLVACASSYVPDDGASASLQGKADGVSTCEGASYGCSQALIDRMRASCAQSCPAEHRGRSLGIEYCYTSASSGDSPGARTDGGASALCAPCVCEREPLYPGTNLRGQIASAHDGRPSAVSKVDLYTSSASGDFTLIKTTSANERGMYYFYAVPPGEYFVQLNESKNFEISVMSLDYPGGVYSGALFEDIPLLVY